MPSARILPSPTNAPRARVVVADDHPICSQLLPTLLEKIGCEVVGVAYDGEIALARCEELKPDILLLDIVLPKVGGLEVLQRIRRRALPIKIILFTGSLQSEMLREAMVWGVEGCLLKTAPVQEIAEAFQRVRDGQLAFGPEASEMMRKLVVSQDEAGALSELETAVLRQTA
ncbi:MAG TPA: response regulator transcription factor, partial [Candidatus Synoicihabitans sp.]|nr:response regulator transcription factor [Candidatus Synoicihabitans sp.]